jgi:hypothetical protein
MLPFPKRLLAATLLGALALGCEHADPLAPDQTDATFTSIQANVFNQSCALSGCHLGGSAPFGLDLSEGNAYDNLVGVASREVPALLRVQAGNPDDSYLVIKLEGSARMAPGTARMPFGRTPLSDEQIGLVRQWIQEGAQRN